MNLVLLSERYEPAVVGATPAQIELLLRLPSQSVTTISIDFERSFLNIDDYPPDVSRGFDVRPTSLHRIYFLLYR